MDIDAFVARWKTAQAAEIANAQSFLIELADLLGVDKPQPDTAAQHWCFGAC